MMTRDAMERLLLAVKIAAGCSVVCVCVAVSLLALRARAVMADTGKGVDVLVMQAAHTMDALQVLIGSAEEPIRLSGKVMNDSRLTLDNVNKAAIDERFYFEQQAPLLTQHVDDVLVSARASVDGMQAAERSAVALLDEATRRTAALEPVETQAVSVLRHVDAVASDPAIPSAIAHVDEASAASASAARHLDGAAADTQTAVHRFLHPTWGVRIVNWMGTAVHAAGGWF